MGHDADELAFELGATLLVGLAKHVGGDVAGQRKDGRVGGLGRSGHGACDRLGHEPQLEVARAGFVYVFVFAGWTFYISLSNSSLLPTYDFVGFDA